MTGAHPSSGSRHAYEHEAQHVHPRHADLTIGAPLTSTARVVELALSYGTITRAVARASRFEARASHKGTPVEVPHVR